MPKAKTEKYKTAPKYNKPPLFIHLKQNNEESTMPISKTKYATDGDDEKPREHTFCHVPPGACSVTIDTA